MADKQQNITVNYKFNTADIERASAILNRANTASNQLQQSGGKAGENISKGFNTARQSIASMEIQLARLKTQIQVSSDPKRVADLSNQYKQLKTSIDAANKSAFETSKAVKQTSTAAQSATQSFGGLITAVRAIVTAGIVKEVFDLSINMARLAGNVEGVERAFNRAIPNAKQVMFELTRATHGAVSELDLMEKALLAKNYGISLEALPKLLEFAAVRAQQTGKSVDYLVNSMVDGIGRKSLRVLDNLQLSTTEIKDEMHGLSLEEASVAQVSEAMGRIASRELDKMGGFLETAATKADQLSVSFTHLKEEASKAFTGDGGLIDLVKEYVDSFSLGLEAINKNISVEELANQKRIEGTAIVSERVFAENALNKSREENIKTIEDEIQRLTEELGTYAKGRQVFQSRIDATNAERDAIHEKRFESQKEAEQFRETIKLNERLRDAHKEDIAIDQEILKLLQGRLKAMQDINEEEKKGEPSGIISRKKKEIEDLQKQIELTNDASNLSGLDVDDKGNTTLRVGKLIEKLEILQAELGDLQRAFTDKIDPKPFKLKIDDASEKLLEFEANIKRIEVGLQDLQLNIPNLAPKPPDTIVELDNFWDGLRGFWEENWRDLAASSADIQADIINGALETEIQAMNAQMDQLKKHYQERQELAGDNERAKSELRIREDRELQALAKKQFEREKSLRKAQVIVDGAAAAVKAFVTAPNVYVAIAQAAFIAASVVAQLRNIEKAQPRFAKGVIDLKGPGTGTSDSIPARLSKGESVMTAWETKHAGDVLKDIRAKKLDNKALRDLKQGRAPIQSHQVFDDSKIIHAINQNKAPDVVKQSNLVYEVRQHTETMRRKQRAKSMNI